MKARDKKEEESSEETASHQHSLGEEGVREEISPENPCSPPMGETANPKADCRCGGRSRKTKEKEQITEILKRVPGVKVDDFRKPKQRPGTKADCLCCDLPTVDAIVPMMAELFYRFSKGDNPRAGYEEVIFAGLSRLNKKQLKALGEGFKGYENLSPRLRKCLFDERLADKVRGDGVQPADVIEAFILEGLAYTAQSLMSNSKGVKGPGQVRIWDAVLPPTPNG